MSSMEKKSLNARDLITLGIFNAIAIACYAAVVAISCTTVVGLFLSTAIAFLVLGTVYMLIISKVRKRGTFIICGLIMSIVGIIGGRITTTLGSIAGGIIAELLVGDYKKFYRIAMAYGGYAAGYALGIFLPGVIMGANYLLQRGSKKGMTAETIQAYTKFYTPTYLVIIVLINVAAAVIGAYIGRMILKKHFVKAGLIK